KLDCSIHFQGVPSEEAVIGFTSTTWGTVQSCAELWSLAFSRTQENAIANNILNKVFIENSFGYHGACYRRFCHKRKAVAAVEHEEKVRIFFSKKSYLN